MRAVTGLWRWRRNPLCRATDLAEAWVALVALVLIAVAAPATGALVGFAAQDSLQRAARVERHTHHQVTATVVRVLGREPEGDLDSRSVHETRTRVVADWPAPDGSTHRGPVLTGLKSPRAGERFGLWTDPQGRVTTRPLDSVTATTHAVLAGFGAALVAAALAETARRLTVWRMVRRRYARWEQAWDRAGPDWGKAGTGS
ncbi:hypothetical protein Shyhy01_35960 [Streptomyces hygroscopicus subsp. hygroscopicus]|nr:hypothetical protein [Streptomyces hygroscopicus]GLX50646.1 hypothetical protein Shyhy01_35960 [Streptomyces hygroscopicus subsp. hygroscopicus]